MLTVEFTSVMLIRVSFKLVSLMVALEETVALPVISKYPNASAAKSTRKIPKMPLFISDFMLHIMRNLKFPRLLNLQSQLNCRSITR